MRKKILSIGVAGLVIMGFLLAQKTPVSPGEFLNGGRAFFAPLETAFAKQQVPLVPKPSTLPGPSETTLQSAAQTRNFFIEKVLPEFVKPFLGAVAVVAVFMLIFGGIQMLTAYGNEEKVTAAKKNITIAGVGLIVSMLSYVIVRIIVSLPYQAPSNGNPAESAPENS